jgi:hypothetical protein
VTTRTRLIITLASALALLSFSGCGGTNHLQAINLTASGSTGFFNLKGEGGTLQIVATGVRSNQTKEDITTKVTYTMTPTGSGLSGPLPAPPMTASISKAGLVTATTPFDCSWVNVGTPTMPVWALSGSYQIVAKFDGITSQPLFVGVASAVGSSGLCGP